MKLGLKSFDKIYNNKNKKKKEKIIDRATLIFVKVRCAAITQKLMTSMVALNNNISS